MQSSIDKNIGIVFIHGAGLGDWIWNDISSLLHTPTWALQFPERNPNRPVSKSLTLDGYTSHIFKNIQEINCEHIVIVAHSIGGLIALKVAEHFGDRIVGFVGIGAAIPKNGGSYLSVLPFPKQLLMNILLRFAGTKPPKSAIMQGLCNDLSADQSKLIIERFVAESPNLYFNKCNASIPKTKKLYVTLNKDSEFPLALQNKMISNLQAKQIATLDAGHLPMLSCPDELAKILNKFIKYSI